ncbi:MAG: hypothetical protein GWM87_08410, partial [Xanthomonadales bacterium]|nr:hypothetical protein [Xanthomonadales bacterium]NIX12951.1 hypothetical protein [Xanthomonadales bacterium]
MGKLAFQNGRRLSIFAVAMLLFGCGGGGSDGGGSPPPPPPPAAPVANAGPDQTVQELTVVNLSGSATDANGDPITYSWAQTAGQMVTLNTPDS